MRELSRNELILLRGILYTKRMYRGMKHIPNDIVIWEEKFNQFKHLGSF